MTDEPRERPQLDQDNPLHQLCAMAIVEVAADEETIRDANHLLAELTGHDLYALIDAPLDLLVPEHSRRLHHRFSLGYAANPEPRPMSPLRQVVLLHHDGYEMRVWIGLAPHSEGHVVAAVMSMGIDTRFGLPITREPQ